MYFLVVSCAISVSKRLYRLLKTVYSNVLSFAVLQMFTTKIEKFLARHAKHIALMLQA